MPGKRKKGRGADKGQRKSRKEASAAGAAAKKARRNTEMRQSAGADMMRNFAGRAGGAL